MWVFSHCKRKDQLGAVVEQWKNMTSKQCSAHTSVFIYTSHKRGFAYMVLFHVAIVNHFITKGTGLLRTQRLSVTKAVRGFS